MSTGIPDYTAKQTATLTAAVAAASSLLVAINRLKECNNLLTQSGGNFISTIFDSGQFVYLDATNADLLLQQAALGIDVFFDTNVGGDTALPTYRQLLQMCVQGPH